MPENISDEEFENLLDEMMIRWYDVLNRLKDQ